MRKSGFKSSLWLPASTFVALILSLPGFLYLHPASRAEAASQKVEQIIASLQKKYDTIMSLSASFEQKNTLKALGRTTTSSGKILLRKPGRLRLEYLKPESQLLIFDGETLWIYTARFNQVMVSKSGSSGFAATPLLFLVGKGNLKKNFNIFVEKAGTEKRSGGIGRSGQPHRIRLEPRSARAAFRRMWIEVEPDNFMIRTLEYIDNIGNRSRLRFSNVQEGVKIEDVAFQFTVPPNAEVVHMSSPGTRNR